MNHWLMKTEPTTFSIDDLASDPDQTTAWEGVRNYQARNLLRDDFKLNDRVLFYHSACKEPAVVGIATVVREGYPDSHAFDRRSTYYDEKSRTDKPTWFMVDIRLEQKLNEPVTLKAMRDRAGLKDMMLLQKGSRLSVQPVKKKDYDTILKMANVKS
jgi:predicted RNA-binding protein with PUA-like domain